MSVQNDAFNQFRKERVRHIKDGFLAVAGEKFTAKELLKAYNKWQIVNSTAKKIELDAFKELCEQEFGDSRGTYIYTNLRVFLDEDDLEDFDKEHSVALKTFATQEHLKESNAALEEKLNQSERNYDRLYKRLEEVFDAVAKRDVQRDKELIKIINSLKTLLTLQ
jgi:flagellar motility protein MotE (MotC chaperone)